MTAILKYNSLKRLNRGGGVESVPLVTGASTEGINKIVTGISAYPRGGGAPFHTHNCDEQVTLLSGVGEVEVNGVITPLEPYDSTYVEADLVHAFRNTGEEPMVILWIYTQANVTRTFADSGETVSHLSDEDLMGADTDSDA
jgi:mannose-6-phosphate isomerase-like protein (cupin superfamily)